MKDCPNCSGSLKEMRDERDRLIAFSQEWRKKKSELAQARQDLEEAAKRLDERNDLLERGLSKLAEDELALGELMNQAKRPDEEWRQLEELNSKLLYDLAAAGDELLKTREMFAEQSRQHEIKQEQLKEKLSKANQRVRTTAEKLEEYQNLYEQLLEKHGILTRSMEIAAQRLEEISAVNRELKESNARLSRDLQEANRRCSIETNRADSLNELNEHLNDRIEKLKSDNRAARARIEALSTTEVELNERIEELENAESKPSFWYDPEILHYLFHNHPNDETDEFKCPDSITTLGSGPIDIDEFDNLLRNHEIEPCSGDRPWIIVGREGWEPEELDALIDDALESGAENLRVFSQELFLLGHLTTHDPFSLPLDILMKFAEDHPALEHLMSGFEWPEIDVDSDLGTPASLKSTESWTYESPLFMLGYQVGITNGLQRKYRREILENAYMQTLPDTGDAEYMREWGRNRSRRRLWRIAHHLRWLIKGRSKIPNMRHAVRDWQEDLDWLYDQYYDERMDFIWPG